MQEEKFKPIDTNEEVIVKPTIINLPNQKTNQSEQNQNIIKELPSWNIEPPIEIKRGQ